MISLHKFRLDLTAALRVVIFLSMIAVMIPFAIVLRHAGPHTRFTVPVIFHKCVLALLGIKVAVRGLPSPVMPTLFVSNHASYLDIIVLASLLRAGFVAKAEVASWPLFGYLAYIQNTMFIDRRAGRAAEQRDRLKTVLREGQSLILFPEGTSSNGRQVLPFKSSLLSAVESAGTVPMAIQPVSLACTRLDGQPLPDPDLYAWHGDMTLLPHLWRVFRIGRFTVEVTFHPPLAATIAADRKLAAAAARQAVADGLAMTLAAS